MDLKCLLVVNEGIFCHLRDPRPSWLLGWARKPQKTPKWLSYELKRLGNDAGCTVQRFQIENAVRYRRRRFDGVLYLFRRFNAFRVLVQHPGGRFLQHRIAANENLKGVLALCNSLFCVMLFTVYGMLLVSLSTVIGYMFCIWSFLEWGNDWIATVRPTRTF